MIKTLSSSLAVFLLSTAFGCQSAPETETKTPTAAKTPAQTLQTPAPEIIPDRKISIDVSKLANKPPAEFEAVFGKPAESKSIENGGEYRLYKIAGYSKGLAVRFYGSRAKSFNLLADEPFQTSKEALRQIFGIDVGGSAPLKEAKEPLTESYRGAFGGVMFKKVSAKKQENGKGFIFVLAEVGE